jgi:hypothetical protein
MPGITAASSVTAPQTRGGREVAARRTPVSTSDIRRAIGGAYKRMTGAPPSSALLDTLTAQASLETGSGAQMYNFNFGGIKGVSPHGDTANYLTHEVVGAHDVTLRQGFRAYASVDDGADDYVRLLSHKFGSALSSAQVGDVHGFAHALKQAGYYTASEDQYASALQSLSGLKAPVETLMAVPSIESAMSGVAYPAGADLSQVLDAISNSALRIANSNHDDE